MRVLIVEDDPEVARSIASLLETQHHECLLAPTAHDGLDLLRHHPIELIFLDVNLPGGLSGYGALETYHGLRPQVPIVLMTGAYTSESDARVAHSLGAAEFLRKPFQAEELFAAVTSTLSTAAATPPSPLSLICEECGADCRIRDAGGEPTVRLRCPNCGHVRDVPRDAQEPAAGSRVPLAPPHLRRRILVADTDEHFRLYLLDLLAEAGHFVATARDGNEALRIAQEWGPDLLITDILLSGMSGLLLCRAIRHDSRLARIPIVAITSLKSEEHGSYAKEAGVDLFLTKPIKAAAFFDQLHLVIAGTTA
jgi:DNA-binding response OmpR family regulator